MWAVIRRFLNSRKLNAWPETHKGYVEIADETKMIPCTRCIPNYDTMLCPYELDDYHTTFSGGVGRCMKEAVHYHIREEKK